MKRKIAKLLILALILSLLAGCGIEIPRGGTPEHTAKNRTYYEIFVGSFYDSDGDGMGDLQGIISKLDYLNNPDGKDCLGVQGIWLMPIHPSPTYHKYDVTDYYAIDPAYGTMQDFEELIAEANDRDINVIIDLVLNHTSTQHPWFVAAKEEIANGAEPYYQNYYNFTDNPQSGGYYPTVGGLYYEAYFWDQMPDLNLSDENLRAEIAEIARFWLEKGAAGFRLDAVMHIFGVATEKNLEFWSWFVNVCKEIREDVFLVGEVWSNENVIMPYFETGLSLFNFPFSNHDGKINAALKSEDGDKLADEIVRYNNEIRLRNPDAFDSMFLSNHDNGRSAGFITDINKRKLAAAIYLMLPGNPFIYYGEEIGMTGSGIDENKRTAMYWSSQDTEGMTRNPIGATNDRVPEFGAAEQLQDPDSLLNYYRAILVLKSFFQDIYDGEISKVAVDNKGICAIRTGSVIVMHNLTGDAARIALPEAGLAVGGYATATGEEASIDDDTLFIPPYSTVILT
ncbi:MAG: alpha-amylase family glycosyl hydrolase [Oscillospiraceae bacterium]|nr:alpha-amylase family glycosyl hydrolase [Oscillospiraceae bacterium]